MEKIDNMDSNCNLQPRVRSKPYFHDEPMQMKNIPGNIKYFLLKLFSGYVKIRRKVLSNKSSSYVLMLTLLR